MAGFQPLLGGSARKALVLRVVLFDVKEAIGAAKDLAKAGEGLACGVGLGATFGGWMIFVVGGERGGLGL